MSSVRANDGCDEARARLQRADQELSRRVHELQEAQTALHRARLEVIEAEDELGKILGVAPSAYRTG